MVEHTGDQAFLRSIFLMEAWDSLAALDDGGAQLASGTEPVWDDVLLVTHRLRGAASLQQFTAVAALADSIEHALLDVRAAPTDRRAQGTAHVLVLLASLKRALEAVERGEGVQAAPAAPPREPAPVTPAPATPAPASPATRRA